MVNLGYIGEDFNIFELAATYVEYSLLPLFNSYKTTSKSQANSGGATSSGFDNITKNLSQLKVHLVQYQQNIMVPEIDLIHDPEIKQKYEEVKQLGRELTPDDFENRISDPSFVKKLEKTVTKWIRDIRCITQLNHNPESGSALQEIQFWLSIERNLTNVEEQLKHQMIDTTLELLKRAQKIQLVYHFRLDTELEQKLTTAKNYNKLLRDFPINQLLSANDLESARRAIDLIFIQFRYIRQTSTDQYPNSRAILLMQCIIKDLNTQLLKILSNF